MELANLFKRSPGSKSGVHAVYLDHLRFIRLLENARALMTLREDGKDKATGEYILDIHYVTALAEEMIRVLGVLVFDACLLRRDGGELLYGRYDREQARVRDLLMSVRQRAGLPDGQDGDDPEYRLLNDVLGWFDRDNGDSVMGFIEEVFDYVMTRSCTDVFPFDRTPCLDLSGTGTLHRLHVLPAGPGGPLPDSPTLDQVRCRPLWALFRDLLRNGTTEDSGGIGTRWAGIVNGPCLSLTVRDDDRILCQVDARLSGEPEADYLFVFMHKTMMDLSLIPDEIFYTTTLREGWLAWCYNRSAAEMDTAFARLGNCLFARTGGGPEPMICETRR